MLVGVEADGNCALDRVAECAQVVGQVLFGQCPEKDVLLLSVMTAVRVDRKEVRRLAEEFHVRLSTLPDVLQLSVHQGHQAFDAPVFVHERADWWHAPSSMLKRPRAV